MKYDVIDLPESHQMMLDETPESSKVKVVLLDCDNVPIASGKAILPMLLGVGVFWPDCPMPGESGLSTAKCLNLPSGESLVLKALNLCEGHPPHYDFWVCQPC